MIIPDEFCACYVDLLENTYDCVDRIVLNGYFRLGHSPGGFRTWWRLLHGSDDNLDNNHLMRMAGRFSRCVRGWAKKNGIPVIDCHGERKHELAEKLLPPDPNQFGIFAVLVSRAPFPVWDVQRFGNGGINLRRKDSPPFVNHYSFQIWDKEWGHLTIKICGHPPFAAQIMLNGHEYVERQASQEGIAFVKEENCFTAIANAAGLNRVADTLRSPDAIGRLRQVCERWIYQCLCFALTTEEQQRTQFRYDYSVYQTEYSRNLLFKQGRVLDQVFHGVIDRTRAPLNIELLKTIFGEKQRPRKGKKVRWEVVVENPTYDLTVLRIHCGKFTLKMYTKGERVLRIEVIVHNAKAMRCGRSLPKFAKIVGHLRDILSRFMEVVRCVDGSCIDDGTLEELPKPSQVGKVRVGGVDIQKARMVAVMEAVLSLSPTSGIFGGCTSSEIAGKVRALKGWPEEAYQPRHAAYDLKKLRGKNLLHKIDGSRRYLAPAEGLRTMTAIGVIRDKVMRPILAGTHPRVGRKPKNRGPLDEHYEALQKEMSKLFEALHISIKPTGKQPAEKNT